MGREPVLLDAEMWQAPTAFEAVRYVEEAFAGWSDLVASIPAADWWSPMGSAAGPFATSDRVALVVHIKDEMIHHGAEVALLRDLYRARDRLTG